MAVCLSTVDRRSRERFIESNNQISALVEKFKLEGGPYRKYAGPGVDIDNMEHHQKIPLTAYGRPGVVSVMMNLVQRSWSTLNLFRWEGFKTLYLKLMLMPSFFFLLWIFYFGAFQSVSFNTDILKNVNISSMTGRTIPKNLCDQEWTHLQLFGWSLLHVNHININNM